MAMTDMVLVETLGHSKSWKMPHCQTSSACFHQLPQCLWPWSRFFLWQRASLLQRKRVAARRTNTLAVCWVLFVSVATATVRLRWQRDSGGGGCYVIHGQWGWPYRAQNLATEPKRTKEEASGGSANTQAWPQVLWAVTHNAPAWAGLTLLLLWTYAVLKEV